MQKLQVMLVVICVLICCHAHIARKASYAQAASVTCIHECYWPHNVKAGALLVAGTKGIVSNTMQVLVACSQTLQVHVR